MNVSTDTHPGQGVSVEVMVDLALAKLPTDLSGRGGGARTLIFTPRAIGIAEEIVVPQFVVPTKRGQEIFAVHLSMHMRERRARFVCFLHHQNNGPGVWGLVVFWAREETAVMRCVRDGLAKFDAQRELAARGGVTN